MDLITTELHTKVQEKKKKGQVKKCGLKEPA